MILQFDGRESGKICTENPASGLKGYRQESRGIKEPEGLYDQEEFTYYVINDRCNQSIDLCKYYDTSSAGVRKKRELFRKKKSSRF